MRLGALFVRIITCSVLAFSDALRDLVPFVQYKKHVKHSWRSALLKAATLLKVAFLHWCFSGFFNCTNGTKSCNASQ